MQKRKVFLICPVRNSDPLTQDKIAAYVQKLENEGAEVYWPRRDNPYQYTDKNGWDILSVNRAAIVDSTEVHIWWDPSSKGSHFDLGMLWMMFFLGFRRRVFLANPEEVLPVPDKDFKNVLLKLAGELF